METNIVLINAPHRHDLISESCVNKEVEKFNRQMKKSQTLSKCASTGGQLKQESLYQAWNALKS